MNDYILAFMVSSVIFLVVQGVKKQLRKSVQGR